MKRSRPLAIGAAALALVLTACSSGTDTPNSSTNEGGPAASVGGAASGTIEYWLWDSGQLPAYQACADAFHAENPDATVTLKQYSWGDYWSKINASFTADTGIPDVFADHLSKYPEFVQKQQILSISDAITADNVDTSIYQKGLLDLWTAQDGKVYGLPKDFDTVGLFYNTDMVKAAGYTADDLGKLEWNPTDGGTFEKFIAHMTIDTNGKRGDEAGFDKTSIKTYGFNLEDGSAGNGQTTWSPFTGSTGWTYTDKNPWGTHYNYDDPKFQDTLTWYRSLMDKGYMQSLAMAAAGDVGKLLAAGTIASTIEGDWNTSGYLAQQPKLGVAPTPIGPTGKRASMFNGLADSINAGTKNQATAVKWVEFTGSAACQDLVAAKAVVFPAVKTSTDKAIAAFKAKGIDPSGFTVHVTDGTTFLFPITDHAADINAIMGPGMQAFLSHQTDASAFTDLNDQVNNLFQ